MAESPAPVRSSLAEEIRELFLNGGELKKIINDALDVSKTVHMDCPHCKKRSLVAIPDDPRRLKAVMELIEQTEGKPGTVDADAAGVQIIVNRLPWPGSDSE